MKNPNTYWLVVEELACVPATNYSDALDIAAERAASYPGRAFFVCKVLSYRETPPTQTPSPTAPLVGGGRPEVEAPEPLQAVA